MKMFLTVFLTLVLSTASVVAVEQIDLTVPDQVKIGTTTYKLTELNFDWGRSRIVIVLVGANGERKEVVYADGEESTDTRDLMRVLNKANLSIKSLHRRVMERLIADGHIVGNISGVPD